MNTRSDFCLRSRTSCTYRSLSALARARAKVARSAALPIPTSGLGGLATAGATMSMGGGKGDLQRGGLVGSSELIGRIDHPVAVFGVEPPAGRDRDVVGVEVADAGQMVSSSRYLPEG